MLGIGYPIAAEALDLELYQLYCTFAASREPTRVDGGHHHIQSLCSTFEQSEAARRLVLIAATVRNGFDAGIYDSTKAQEKVGEVFTDLSKPNTLVDLSFREACNKILHADSVELAEEVPPKPLMLKYSVTLQGMKGKQHWQATIDVLKFIEAAYIAT